jgi:hypothetical protein
MNQTRLIALLATALAAPLVAPSPVSGDGLPLPVDATEAQGVTSPAGDFHYTTVSAGSGTVALRIATGSGEVDRIERLDGEYGVPLVAYDGTASGISAGGERLVLIRPRTSFPRRTTEFAVLDAERLRVIEELTLRDDFSFDAISPDGRLMYLIRYLDPRDPTAYEVRAYDLERERLLREPIVDEDEAPVTMGGFPQTRAMSPDQRWAYTLYASNDRGRVPFIHALDTETGNAACIDLDPGLVNPQRLWRMDLVPSADGSTLDVVDRGEPVASVDLRDFSVSEPAVADANADNGDVPWAVLGGAAVVLAILGGLAAGRRGRRRAIDADALERLVESEQLEKEPVH